MSHCVLFSRQRHVGRRPSIAFVSLTANQEPGSELWGIQNHEAVCAAGTERTASRGRNDERLGAVAQMFEHLCVLVYPCVCVCVCVKVGETHSPSKCNEHYKHVFVIWQQRATRPVFLLASRSTRESSSLHSTLPHPPTPPTPPP